MVILTPNFGSHFSAKIGSELPALFGRELPALTKLMPAAVGQLNMYLNYYAEEVNEGSDNPPIGIILCTDRDFLGAEYALGGLNNNIFASKYTYIIPDKEELIAQVEAVLEKMEDRKDV